MPSQPSLPPHPSAQDLLEVELFADLPEDERARVASWFAQELAEPGERLTRQQADEYEFVVLRHGRAEVNVDGRVVRELSDGDFLGEISLIHGPRATATVTVTAPSTVWRMFGTSFRQLQSQLPQVAARIEQVGEQRLAGDQP